MAGTLAVTGWGVVASTGVGADEFGKALVDGQSGLRDVGAMFAEELPQPAAHALVDFDVRDHLGRKRTGSLDRTTAFAVTAAGLALADSGIRLDDENRDETGIVLGNTMGSFRSIAEFDRETLVNERPYLVEPLLFPNSVMNCAASRCAIWHQLRGVNATIPAGRISAVSALRYGGTLLRRGHARTLLLGAVEEFSAHRAWLEHHAHADEPSRAPLGEAAALLVTEDARAVRAAGRPLDAEILATKTGHFDPADRATTPADGLAQHLGAALDAAGVTAEQVTTVATGECGLSRVDAVERAAVEAVLGTGPDRLRAADTLGDCGGASAAVQLAAVLALHRDDPGRDGQVSVVTSCDPEGGVGVVVLRGWSRRGALR
ncbi:beta-ketoacyl synthase N-terminal-like domain-containing protein [Streptomyces sp. ESR1.13]|uniref:beta-ketoacyl synthase N-terminal-like domain-containing protein n=1 Tax=Streptomyces TaxID=1883 RepID=UPI0004C7D22D|nr:beta-ketoacyl synthase N-terminal-like domain-containing protein [Streptomyces sp. NRRL S-1831]